MNYAISLLLPYCVGQYGEEKPETTIFNNTDNFVLYHISHFLLHLNWKFCVSEVLSAMIRVYKYMLCF